ncbi:MAG: sugar transferase [Paludibacter sp.]|nr:sugar transferase [Paludibacter sp.]
MIYYFNVYSHKFLYLIATGEFIANYLFLTVYFYYRYAIKYEEESNNALSSEQTISKQNTYINDEKSIQSSFETINKYSGVNVLNFLQKHIKFDDGNSMVLSDFCEESMLQLGQSQCSTIIQLEKLNQIKGINKMLSAANNTLPDSGLFVCNFQTKSTYKCNQLKKYSKGINYLFYSFDFLFKRIFPKLLITRWFYYIFSGCKYRVLSKAEVMGRLYYCGFKIELEKKIGNSTYIFARKIYNVEHLEQRTYGPLIRLKRLGKDSKIFYVYKMRTMHPYSEFLQAYIYEKNSLQEGGKFNKDIRITTLGKFMRKFWLDEFPMIINLFKGEMKLVGVRPLSNQYFSLYNKELQEKRVKFKPGLLPPFYADMPKTLAEIQASEMKYLSRCEEKNTLSTDISYLFLILKNILLKNARSA